MFVHSVLAVLFWGCLHSKRTDYTNEALKDSITSLPGLSTEISSQYTMFSGYIDVYPANNRSIFYWFVESLNNATSDPVALWTNGGPGCSGLTGFFTEQGPFRLHENLTLYVNDYSWVNLANMIFIEIPVGVGFSHSAVTSDYTTDDNKTAIDNYHFIQTWLEKYPNYKSNEFYITSESYGGHYMPTLAQQIVIGNNAGGDPAVNFKGFFLGNPYTDPVENQKGNFDTLYGHQMISRPTWLTWFKACDDGNITDTDECQTAMEDIYTELGDNINPYALDYPVCESDSNGERFWFLKEVVHKALKRPIPLFYKKMINSFKKKVNLESKFDHLEDYHECEGDWMTSYLNEKSVQNAIHAYFVDKSEWSMCGGVNYDGSSSLVWMEPIYKWLIASDANLHITIVSGDDDTVCGSLGTQSWIYNMGYEISSDWSAWIDSQGQTGGYLVKFKDAFNFVTVHTAGHMIPETTPMRSYEAFKRYLNGEF